MRSHSAPVRWMGLALVVFGLAIMLALAPMARADGGFVDTGLRFPGVSWGRSRWGDYDRDRELDFAVFGFGPEGTGKQATLYRNDGGVFFDASAPLHPVSNGDIEWGDFDNDGDLDLLIAADFWSILYPNNDTAFNDKVFLTGVNGSADWVDYDNDGDQDIYLAGQIHTGRRTSFVARNDLGVFAERYVGIPAFLGRGMAWGDYDDDGDLDVAVGAPYHQSISDLYRNENGLFSPASASFAGLAADNIAWGDYDNDGDLDLFLTGEYSQVDRGYLFRNDDGQFVDSGIFFPQQTEGSAEWGDFDNDGDLDLLVTGGAEDMSSDPQTHLFRNTGSGFEDWATGMLPSAMASAAWGDYDGDRDLDVLLALYDNDHQYSLIYRNDGFPANAAPTAPTGLVASSYGPRVDLGWSAASDDHTPAQSLTYNLRVGTTPGGCEIMSPMAAADGWRYLPAMGNAQLGTTAWLSLPMGIYYWSVQAIDGAYVGGPFAQEGMFTVGPYVQVAVTDARESWYAGWNWDYQITVTRTVPVSNARVLVTDTLPAGVYPVSIPAGATQNPDGSITWDLGDLAPGAVRTLSLKVCTLPTVRGAVVNHVAVSCANEPPQTAEDTTTIGVGSTALAVSDGRDEWYAGWNWDYTISLTRSLSITALDVLVTDTLPAGVYAIAVPDGAVENEDGSITWSLGDLAPGATRQLSLWVRTLTTVRGPITNTVTVSSALEPPQSASDTTTIVAPPAPTATATATPTSTPEPTVPPTTIPPTLDAPPTASPWRGGWLPVILK